MATKERFVIDENGTRTAVLIDVEYYQKLLDALEELESIRAYDEAKESGDEIVSFEQAIR
jgi:PHD/YefM family antitoxin component YafN of YafNO toxin-antitoxin module